MLVAALSCAALMTSLGCGRERGYFGNTDRGHKTANTLYISSAGEPEHLDPGRSADTNSAQLISAMFEGLLVYGPRDLRPVQGVARAWDRSDDGRVYRFHLRPEARWSDGRPVTSHDFEYAWKRVLRRETASRSAPELYPIKNAELVHRSRLSEALLGVRAIDDHTLDVELERPTPYFLALTCRPAFAPVRRDVIERLERQGEAELWVRPENIVVNGPYTLDTWKFQYEITMKQNPYYWAKDTLRLHRIVWLEIDSSHAAMRLYQAGEIDALGGSWSPPPEYMPLLEDKRDLVRFPLLMIYWYELNTRVRPIYDIRVRRALDLAVDKRALVDRVTRGGHVPASHYVPENTGSGYAEQAAADRAAGADPFAGQAHDPERARALLRNAGYELIKEGGGFRAKGFPPLEVLYTEGDDAHRQIAIAIQDMWRRHLGVAVSLRSEEFKVMLNTIQQGQFQIVASGWVADYNHPYTFLETFLSGSPNNASGFSDATFDALLARAEGASDPEESIRVYRQAEERAVLGMSRLPLFFPAGSMLRKPWIKGFYGNGRSMDLVRWLWIDPAFRDHPMSDEPASAPPDLPKPGRIGALY
jgi:oligopeptide transport system substrate-binding protein